MHRFIDSSIRDTLRCDDERARRRGDDDEVSFVAIYNYCRNANTSWFLSTIRVARHDHE